MAEANFSESAAVLNGTAAAKKNKTAANRKSTVAASIMDAASGTSLHGSNAPAPAPISSGRQGVPMTFMPCYATVSAEASPMAAADDSSPMHVRGFTAAMNQPRSYYGARYWDEAGGGSPVSASLGRRLNWDPTRDKNSHPPGGFMNLVNNRKKVLELQQNLSSEKLEATRIALLTAQENKESKRLEMEGKKIELEGKKLEMEGKKLEMEGKKLEKESKMMEAYNNLISQDTISMSDEEKAERVAAMKCFRKMLFPDII